MGTSLDRSISNYLIIRVYFKYLRNHKGIVENSNRMSINGALMILQGPKYILFYFFYLKKKQRYFIYCCNKFLTITLSHEKYTFYTQDATLAPSSYILLASLSSSSGEAYEDTSMLDLLLCPYQQKKLNPAKHWKRSLMATFNCSTISFLLLSALVSTLFFLCLSPLNQTIRISTRLSSLHSPNYSIEEAKSNHTFERFQSFPSPTTTVGDEEISAPKDKVKLVWWF